MFWVGQFLVGLAVATVMPFSGAHAQAEKGPGYLLVELNVSSSQNFDEYVADANRSASRTLFANRNREIIETVVVVANRDHFGDQAVFANDQRLFGGQSAMMTKNRARTDVERAVAFDCRVAV